MLTNTKLCNRTQFRASIRLRPHGYLVRQRIERAQQLLAETRLPLAEVALEVGFKAQAHFTTVFSKIVGETPMFGEVAITLTPSAQAAQMYPANVESHRRLDADE